MRRLTKAGITCAAVVGIVATPAVAQAEPVPPRHAVVVCDSASFWGNYDHAQGPVEYKRTLQRGNKVGHTPGAHPVFTGWAASMDFGPNDWGYLRIECIGGYDSW